MQVFNKVSQFSPKEEVRQCMIIGQCQLFRWENQDINPFSVHRVNRVNKAKNRFQYSTPPHANPAHLLDNQAQHIQYNHRSYPSPNSINSKHGTLTQIQIPMCRITSTRALKVGTQNSKKTTSEPRQRIREAVVPRHQQYYM